MVGGEGGVGGEVAGSCYGEPAEAVEVADGGEVEEGRVWAGLGPGPVEGVGLAGVDGAVGGATVAVGCGWGLLGLRAGSGNENEEEE